MAGDAERVRNILAKEPSLAQARVHLYMPGETTLLNHVARHGEPGHVAVARLLIEHGADVNAVGNEPNTPGCTPLTGAARFANVPMVELLLESGADPNARDGHGCSAVDRASEQNNGPIEGSPVVFEACVAAGASYTLSHTITLGLFDRTVELLDRDPDLLNERLPGPKDWRGQRLTPLHVAVGGGWPERIWPRIERIFKLLLDRGADIHMTDGESRSPLLIAIEKPNHQAKTVLLERGAVVDIFAASALGDAERVGQMLDEDPSLIRAHHADGVTPLVYATAFGGAEVAEVLLQRGADPQPATSRWDGCRPLHFASEEGKDDLCRLLLDHGADVDVPIPGVATTPLQCAARSGHVDAVALLLGRGADVNSQGQGGLSALHWAAWGRHLSVGELLVEWRPDMNLRSDPMSFALSRTPLHFAAHNGHVAFVGLLLDHGADVSVKDRDGRTALDLAEAAGKEGVADLLREQATE